MAFFVYILCAITSATCSVLLLRQYRRSHSRLLFHSGIAFLCFAVANVILFIDLALLGPETDLKIWRNLVNLVGVVLLLFSLIQGKETR
jgi:hypothetical protein